MLARKNECDCPGLTGEPNADDPNIEFPLPPAFPPMFPLPLPLALTP